jgi:hypothetical protein
MKTAIVLTALVCAPFTVLAQGTDELWEINMKMEMAGAPVAMPMQTQKVCKPKGKQDEAPVPEDSKCKLVDSKRSGAKSTFRMACEDGKNKYTIDGETESTGPDGYRGKMHTVGKMDGEQVDMTQTFSGRKLGSCAYEDPAKKQKEMMAQQNEMVVKECRKAIDDFGWQIFAADGTPCASVKGEFCGRMTKVSGEMRDPAGYRNYAKSGRDWQGAFKHCGIDAAGVTRDACKASSAKRDWQFVVDNCEQEAKALAKQQCEGRSYTAAMQTEYAPICSKYAAHGRSYTAVPATQGTPAKPSATDSIKQGADKLKKFLKF